MAKGKAAQFWLTYWPLILEISMDKPILLDLLIWAMNSNLNHNQFVELAKIIDRKITAGKW